MTPVPTTVDAPMDLSIKNRRKMRLEEFLRQNLDQAPAGRVIQWVDRNQGIFRILWTHQSSGAFTQQDAALFRYWALARGKPPNLSSVELKQSLRMALNKSPSVQRLNSLHDEYRYFRFTEWGSRKASSSSRSCQRPNSYSPTDETNRKRSSPPARPSPPLFHHHHHHQEVPHIAGSSHFLPDPLLVKSEAPLEPMALPWPHHDLERPMQCRHGDTINSIPLNKLPDPFAFEKSGDSCALKNAINLSTLEKTKSFFSTDKTTPNPFALEKITDLFDMEKTNSLSPPSLHTEEEHVIERGMWQEKQQVTRNSSLLASRLTGCSAPRTSCDFPHLTETNNHNKGVRESLHLPHLPSSDLFLSVPSGGGLYNAEEIMHNARSASAYGGGASAYSMGTYGNSSSHSTITSCAFNGGANGYMGKAVSAYSNREVGAYSQGGTYGYLHHTAAPLF